ncbi:MAG TPA: CHASE sensor domain-containing protein [Povalibacter sp.]|uniref:ATP-binding protein n=1 Tax=Povalibacter sp. TaxID=1962978 RepID=UPI002C03A999|nr:ATP-binding protein [Povalibacter sp.]HMN43016.1 CHASE sensor domain-containing protein [Povalibacter sp.]
MTLRRRLMRAALLTSGLALLLTLVGFVAAQLITLRESTVAHQSSLGNVIAANSSAALAFQDPEAAREILAALRADPNVVAAELRDPAGSPFAVYPADASPLPVRVPEDGEHSFEGRYLIAAYPVVQGGRTLGTLVLTSDMAPVYRQLLVLGVVAAIVALVALFGAYLLSRPLQRQISEPIAALVGAASAVSGRGDYSVRAARLSDDELGRLTDTFNDMLARIESQLGRLNLHNRITRAIGDRQDLPSIFRVVLQHLEDDMPIDFGCMLLYDSASEVLTVGSAGPRSAPLARQLAMAEGTQIVIEPSGFARSVRGELVYAPDLGEASFELLQGMVQAGLRSLVAAPLMVESRVFGVLVAARRAPRGFSSGDCEFLRQLSEHVGLASHQAHLHSALQLAYDELRQTQKAVMQQERLRALGQMASGVAHDINNAISPIALYTESLLEREAGLSERGRGHLTTIQQAIEDVAQTVGRMREFYRPREAQFELARVDLNRVAQQVLELTRVRWSDVLQERGIVIAPQIELAAALPSIMGAEGEIRDALTNLIFNAVDAMPEGGTLGIRTCVVSRQADAGLPADEAVILEVSDTGVGMDEDTRRRCMEPFFTTKGERGSGLGLAMVYGMARRHSAELDIESAVGRGTTVRLKFAVRAGEPESVVRLPADSAARRRLRLLIIDDDPVIIDALREILEGDGHAVVAADGGRKGIDVFAAALSGPEPFSAVITDLGMPYVDGRQVAADVKALSAATPVLLLTGWGQRLLDDRDIPPCVDRVLKKPPRLRELRSALAELTLPA